MNKIIILFFAALSIIFTGCSLLDNKEDFQKIEGAYSIQGWNPGVNFQKQCQYDGTGTVKKTSDGKYIFTVKLNKDNSKDYKREYSPCIISPFDEVITLNWKDSNNTEGCDILYPTEKGFNADWVYLNNKRENLGKEIWTKQAPEK